MFCASRNECNVCNVVLLTGSPRRNGNSFRLAERLSSELEALGAEVTRFDSAFLEVSGCKACGKCYSSGKPCIFDHDDFNTIAQAIERASGLVLITPVNWFAFPAKLKAVIDRFYAFWCGKHLFTGKKCVLIAVCADEPIQTFEGMLFSYRESIALLQGENMRELLLPGIQGLDQVDLPDVQAEMKKIAKAVVGLS